MLISYIQPYCENKTKFSSLYRTSKASVLRDRDGEWRIYGFGMACMHASDYDRVGGFSQDIHGWGLEDEDLFKKFLSDTSITVLIIPIFWLNQEK